MTIPVQTVEEVKDEVVVLLKHTGEDVVAVPHPALAVVVAEAVVCLLNHRSKLIDATDVVWVIIGQRIAELLSICVSFTWRA